MRRVTDCAILFCMPSGSFEKNIRQYAPTDDAQFSNKELTRAYWFATHKVLLRNIGIVFLLLIDVALVGYAVFGLVNYVLIGNAREREGVTSAAAQVGRNTSARLAATAPEPLIIGTGEAQSFPSHDGYYDLVAPIENPNEQWYVDVSFAFNDGPVRFVTLLPKEKKFLTHLGRAFPDGAPGNVTVNVLQQEWQRIDSHEIPDVGAFMKSHHSFEISDARFVPAGLSEGGVAVSGNKIVFTIKNATPFNFVIVPLQVALLQGGSLVGIEETADMLDFKTGETRKIDLRSYGSVANVDEVRVIPSVNVFDSEVYSEQ